LLTLRNNITDRNGYSIDKSWSYTRADRATGSFSIRLNFFRKLDCEYRNVRNALVNKFSYQVHYQIEETHSRKLSGKGDGRPERGFKKYHHFKESNHANKLLFCEKEVNHGFTS